MDATIASHVGISPKSISCRDKIAPTTTSTAAGMTPPSSQDPAHGMKKPAGICSSPTGLRQASRVRSDGRNMGSGDWD